MAGITGEEQFGAHVGCRCRDRRIEHLEQTIADERQQGDNNKPDQRRSGTDDGGIFQTDDIAQTQHGCPRIDAEYQLGLVGQGRAPAEDPGREDLCPGTEGGYQKIIDTTDQTGNDQGFGLAGTLFAGNEHLSGGGSFRERVFAVHVRDKILAEGNQEQDAQHAAQQGADKDLDEVDCHVGVLGLQDVQGRQGEDGSGHDYARAGANGLDNDILPQGILAS